VSAVIAESRVAVVVVLWCRWVFVFFVEVQKVERRMSKNTDIVDFI
jgi:hypothetical protein